MSISTTARNDLVRLVVGMFDAAPGATYLAALETQFEAGRTLAQIAVNLTATGLFQGIYPASTSSAQFLDAFLGNLLGTEVAAAPLAWARSWALAKLTAGTSRGEVILQAVQALAELPASNTAWANAKTALENKVEVANYYSVTKAQSAMSLASLQAVISTIDSRAQSVTAAKQAIDDGLAGPGPGPGTGSTFTLTAGVDQGTVYAGTAGNDTYNGTYDATVTDTFNAVDILVAGGGTDTLNISHIIDVAITPPDALWAALSGFEKVVINTTGNGEQTITTGANFEAAFVANGVHLTTKTTGAGAINLTLSTFSGSATLVTESLAGAQSILTGPGTTSVNATSAGGALTIQGAGLVSVTAVTTGGGAQTIISTSTQAVTVNSTLGQGALVIVTGTGNDTITLLSTDAAGTNLITANAGADTITLVTGPFAAGETVVIGDADSGITYASADKISNFASGADLLKMGTAADATSGIGNYVEAGSAVADFAAALVAGNAALAALNATSGGTELYAFQFDSANGYLFNDPDSDGDADQVIVLVGLTGTTFAAADIVI